MEYLAGLLCHVNAENPLTALASTWEGDAAVSTERRSALTFLNSMGPTHVIPLQ